MHLRTAFLCAGFCFLTTPAMATDCKQAYQNAAHDYWMIVYDMVQFKSMFDHYDQLCSKNAPETIQTLSPLADQLRGQVRRDIDDAKTVIAHLFDNVLPSRVPATCTTDDVARDTVKTSLLQNMNDNASMAQKRLSRSHATSNATQNTTPNATPSPANDPALKICNDLPHLANRIQKHLGPTLENPLLEMAALHSAMVRNAAAQRRDAFKTYRTTLKKIRED